MQVNDKVLVISDWTNPSSNIYGVLQKMNVDNDYHEVSGELYWKSFVLPMAAEEQVIKIQQIRRGLKKAFDDSMGLVYELLNQISRGEIK